MERKSTLFRFVSFILAIIITATSFDTISFASVQTDELIDCSYEGGSDHEIINSESYEEYIYGATEEYVVTISANGGEELPDNDKKLVVKKGEKYGEKRPNKDLPIPKQNGFLFAGWNMDENGNGEYIDENTIVEASAAHTIYAQWVPVNPAHDLGNNKIGGICGATSDGKNANWEINNYGVLTITGTSETANYVFEDVPWNEYKKRVIKSVVIQDTITSIGSNMFRGCELLTGTSSGPLELKNVTKIGDHAFTDCTRLTAITSNAKIGEIGEEAFMGCENLERITTGSKFNIIGKGAFSGCKKLETIELGDDVATISERAFYRCISLNSVILPESTRVIQEEAFKGCEGLKEIRIPQNVNSIAANAFDSIEEPGIIRTTIIAVPNPEGSGKSNGQDYVERMADVGKLTNYFVEPLVTVNKGKIPSYEFIGEPLNIVNDLFNVANREKYKNIKYKLYGTSAIYNEMNEKGELKYLDVEGDLEIQIIIENSDHFLGVGEKDKIVAKVHVGHPKGESEFRVKYNPNGGALTGASSIAVTPYHRIPVSPSDPIYRFTSYNKSYENIFLGWFTDPQNEHTKWDMKKNTVSGNMTLYARWETDPRYIADKKAREDSKKEDGTTFGDITVIGIGKKEKVEYTGKPITFPDLKVYCDDALLVKGVDYTIKYENNVNVGEALIRIIGKGNYTEEKEITFEITKVDLVKKYQEGRLLIDDVMYFKHTGNRIEGKPTVKLEKDGKYITLKAGRDFVYEYPDGFEKYIEPNDPNDPDNTEKPYIIRVTGAGNYNERKSITVREIITKSILINSFNYKVVYDSKGKPGVEVYASYRDEKGNSVRRYLIKDQDFKVEEDEENCVLIVQGIGKYSGVKKVDYGIQIKTTGFKMKTPAVALFYTGDEVKPVFELYDKKDSKTPLVGCMRGEMEEGVKYDYVYEYIDNIKAGKAKIVIKGRGKYSGTVSKTYTILPFDILKNCVLGTREIKVVDIPDQIMLKSGVKPKVVINDITYVKNQNGSVSENAIELVEGRDYTLSYSNNKKKASSSLGDKAPTVKIKGIGNYKGNIKKSFTIVQSDIGKFDDSQIMVYDVLYREQANIYKPKVLVRDFDLKNLGAGSDYNKITKYTYAANCEVRQKGSDAVFKRVKGEDVKPLDIIPSNTKIDVEIKAKTGGNYKGEAKKSYRIIDKQLDISKATATVEATPEYTGEAIALKTSDISVILNGVMLDNSTKNSSAEFEIIGYEKNINKGKATVYIRGKEGKNKIPYGGIKKITFTIVPKRIRQ